MAAEVDAGRIEDMDARGYSHKPLVRVDISDEKVLDTLEEWGVFDWTLHNREELATRKDYACWMTDAEDIALDDMFVPGTSIVLISPSGFAYAVHRHSHDGKWEPAFAHCGSFEEACHMAQAAAEWESGNRKALEEYRKQAA